MKQMRSGIVLSVADFGINYLHYKRAVAVI
jgi:hypothetical protein